MQRRAIPPDQLVLPPFSHWDDRWFLLTAGDWPSGVFNTMTVSWGSFGTIWNRPFAQVVVRPTRHTFRFMEEYRSFTLCSFPSEHHEALTLLGTRSGRDGDKIAASGLTPEAATSVAAPAFAEADLVVECRTIYWDDLEPGRFLDPSIDRNYPGKDYHRIYFGEAVAVSVGREFREPLPRDGSRSEGGDER